MAETERDHPYGPFVRILNAETIISDHTLENGVVIRMHCHYGHIDAAHFDRMCRLHPVGTYTYG